MCHPSWPHPRVWFSLFLTYFLSEIKSNISMRGGMAWWKRTLNADFPVRSARKLIGFSKCVPFDPFCTPCFQMKRSLCAPTFNEETFIFVSKFLLRVISFFLPKLLRSFFTIRLLVLFCPAPVCLWQLCGKHLLTITMMKTQVYDRYLKKHYQRQNGPMALSL